MTLAVTTFHRDGPAGNIIDDPFPKDASYLAGFERYREHVWGSDAVKRRGARFLPVLRDGDLFVEAEDLDAFEEECTALLEQADSLAVELSAHVDAEGLRFRLRNFLAAVAKARAHPYGGVCIG